MASGLQVHQCAQVTIKVQVQARHLRGKYYANDRRRVPGFLGPCYGRQDPVQVSRSITIVRVTCYANDGCCDRPGDVLGNGIRVHDSPASPAIAGHVQGNGFEVHDSEIESAHEELEAWDSDASSSPSAASILSDITVSTPMPPPQRSMTHHTPPSTLTGSSRRCFIDSPSLLSTPRGFVTRSRSKCI